jgi:hypothetical protein
MLRSLVVNVLFLVLEQKLWVKLDIAWLVHSVDVSECSGDGEVRANLGQSRVDLVDILRLSVEGIVVHVLVVDTILFATSDTDLHLEPALHWSGALQILGRIRCLVSY